MSLDSVKASASWTPNSAEDEARTRQFLTTIARDLSIAGDVARSVHFSGTDDLPSVFAVSDFATAAVAAAGAAIAEFVGARFGSL